MIYNENEVELPYPMYVKRTSPDGTQEDLVESNQPLKTNSLVEKARKYQRDYRDSKQWISSEEFEEHHKNGGKIRMLNSPQSGGRALYHEIIYKGKRFVTATEGFLISSVRISNFEPQDTSYST
jgi:hypothetical protein|tara:strand:+ start:209 stop:580 length:372 start_codon:yes stop_codon:yes gene_type:complete